MGILCNDDCKVSGVDEAEQGYYVVGYTHQVDWFDC